MYGCERWTIKKAEHQRTDAFELCFWRRLLRVSWTARRSNQSVLKEVNPEYSLEGLMLKLQHFGHLTQRADSLEKILMLGKIEGRGRRGKQRMRWLDSITDSTDMHLSKLLQSMASQRVGPSNCTAIRGIPSWITDVNHSEESRKKGKAYGQRSWFNPENGLYTVDTCLVTSVCLTLCNLMDCSPPGSSVREIARGLQWVAMPSSRGSSWPRDRTHIPCIAGGFFPAEPPGKPHILCARCWAPARPYPRR